jgi:hypothetical protein
VCVHYRITNNQVKLLVKLFLFFQRACWVFMKKTNITAVCNKIWTVCVLVYSRWIRWPSLIATYRPYFHKIPRRSGFDSIYIHQHTWCAPCTRCCQLISQLSWKFSKNVLDSGFLPLSCISANNIWSVCAREQHFYDRECQICPDVFLMNNANR